MLARRIIAVSSDEAFGLRLASALQAVRAEVELHRTIESLGTGELQAALCVIHLDGALADVASALLPRLGCPVIAVLPRANLAKVVDVMQSSERVAGMLVADDLAPHQLAALATRILGDDVFGLEKVMVEGTQIHTQSVGDYREKSLCMAQVSGFVDQLGGPRRHREPIDQCLDEMLMNALYDAPVDARGKHIFAGVPTRTRITLRTEQRVVVQYACDGNQVAIAVRDAFGTLDRHTVLRYLHKCLHSAQQVDRKAGGAGLGLYLMLSSATAVYFNVLPGIATEAICMFDLAGSKAQLDQFGFLVQRDPAGRLATGPTRAVRAGPWRPSRLAIGGMIAAVAAVLGVVVGPRVFGAAEPTRVTVTTIPKGATIEVDGLTVGTATDGSFSITDLEIGRAYPVIARLEGYEAKHAVVQPHAGGNELSFELQALATVELDSQPPDAAVEIDGTRVGSTPLTVTSLVPGATVSVVFNRLGYRSATERLEVPGRGTRTRLVKSLEVSDEFVRVRFVSNPPGAEIVPSGQRASVDRTYTPAEVFVEANKVQRFTLTMPKHVPVVIEPFTPARGAGALEKGGDLVDGVTLRIVATAGKVTVSGAPHCTEVAPPVDCTLAPGTYVVDYLGPDNAKVTRSVVMGSQEAIETFELAKPQ